MFQVLLAKINKDDGKYSVITYKHGVGMDQKPSWMLIEQKSVLSFLLKQATCKVAWVLQKWIMYELLLERIYSLFVHL